MGLGPRKTIEYGKSPWNVVYSPDAPRPTTQQPERGEDAAPERSETTDRGDGIVRAGGIVFAAWAEQRRYPALIPAYRPNHRPGHDAHDLVSPPGLIPWGRPDGAVSPFAARWATRANSVSTCRSSEANSVPGVDGLARMITSHESGSSDSCCRANTRKRRLTAFLVTALPTALDTASPRRRFGPGPATPVPAPSDPSCGRT